MAEAAAVSVTAEAAVCIPEEAEAVCARAAAATDPDRDLNPDLNPDRIQDPDRIQGPDRIPDPDRTPDPDLDPIPDPDLIPDQDPIPYRSPAPDGADTGIITTIISGIPRGSADL